MIITKTPFRMSFFGGGTDLPQFFEKNDGAVLSTTFNKYCYVTVRHLPRFFEYKTHLTYSQMEYVNAYDEIEHPAIREAMRYLDMHEIRLTYESDLPARSGLGTSSSFAVGMLNAFYCLKGKYIDKKRLAQEAIYLERDLCKEAGGWQDQIAAAYGGLNRIDFRNGMFHVNPVIISPDRKRMLNKRLMLFFTGFSRLSSEIQEKNKNNMKQNENILREMYGLVNQAEDVLTNPSVDLEEFGKLLDYTWMLKRQTGKHISLDSIDDVYKRGKMCGAIGGKLLGAGGGGFLLFYVEPEYQEKLKSELKDLLYVPFEFEDEGTSVIHYSPEEYAQSEMGGI